MRLMESHSSRFAAIVETANTFRVVNLRPRYRSCGARCAFKANRAPTGQRPIRVLLFSGLSARTAVRLCSLATRKTPMLSLSSSVRLTIHPSSHPPVTYGHHRRNLGITSIPMRQLFFQRTLALRQIRPPPASDWCSAYCPSCACLSR